MKPATTTITIDRPREELYALLSDLRAHEQFTDHFLVDFTGEPDRVRARAKVPGPPQWAEITLVEAAEPSRLVERAVGAGGRRETQGTYHLEPTPSGGTQVTFAFETLRAPAPERIAAPVLRAFVGRQNAKAMQRLKALAESAPVAA